MFIGTSAFILPPTALDVVSKSTQVLIIILILIVDTTGKVDDAQALY